MFSRYSHLGRPGPPTFLCLDSDSGVLGLVGLKGGRVLLVNCETGVVRARFSHNYRYVRPEHFC